MQAVAKSTTPDALIHALKRVREFVRDDATLKAQCSLPMCVAVMVACAWRATTHEAAAAWIATVLWILEGLDASVRAGVVSVWGVTGVREALLRVAPPGDATNEEAWFWARTVWVLCEDESSLGPSSNADGRRRDVFATREVVERLVALVPRASSSVCIGTFAGAFGCLAGDGGSATSVTRRRDVVATIPVREALLHLVENVSNANARAVAGVMYNAAAQNVALAIFAMLDPREGDAAELRHRRDIFRTDAVRDALEKLRLVLMKSSDGVPSWWAEFTSRLQ